MQRHLRGAVEADRQQARADAHRRVASEIFVFPCAIAHVARQDGFQLDGVTAGET